MHPNILAFVIYQRLFYNYRVNDNISITPGVYFIFSPEGFSANNTAIVGALRTTFTF
ncbi:hypothetical protein NSTCB13_00037 [Nostoc sp. DSM 114160]|jgi:carbohydrate-selective porin OprB